MLCRGYFSRSNVFGDTKIWTIHGKKKCSSHQKEIYTCSNTDFREDMFHGSPCQPQNPQIFNSFETSDLSLKNSWATYGPGNSNRLEIVIID